MQRQRYATLRARKQDDDETAARGFGQQKKAGLNPRLAMFRWAREQMQGNF